MEDKGIGKEFGETIVELLESKYGKPEEQRTRNLLIQKQDPDKHAAAKRYAIVEELLRSWFHQVNSVNNREIPNDLAIMYDKAYELMWMIKAEEEKIITGGK